MCYPKLRGGYVSFAATFGLGRRKREASLPGDHVEVLSRSLGLSEIMKWEEDFSLNGFFFYLCVCVCVCTEQVYESHLLQEKKRTVLVADTLLRH